MAISKKKNFYHDSVKNMKILTREEETEICERIKAGDKLAEQELIKSSLRTVNHIAIHYLKKGVELDDLIQEGSMGLIAAAQNFNPEENVRFNTYAIFWIRQRMQRFYHTKVRTVRIPVGKEAKRHAIFTFTNDFKQRFRRNPSIEEIAEGIGNSPEFVQKLILDTAPSCSLDTEVSDDSTNIYGLYQDNRYSPEEYYCQQSEMAFIRSSLKCLSEREQLVIKMRFGFLDREYTLKEVGQKLELSHESCRQIQMKAMEKIGKYISDLKVAEKI